MEWWGLWQSGDSRSLPEYIQKQRCKPLWDKQNVCNRTWGGRRWKVQVSDLFTTPSTSLWQLSYWLREALLTEKNKEKNLCLVKILFWLFLLRVPSRYLNMAELSLLCPFGLTCIHCISSGLSRLSASSTLIFSQAMLRPAARSGRWHSH